jgi:AraC-like DNA-binding protein
LKNYVYNIPDLFFDGKPSATNIHFYHTNKSSKNNKVSFSQNLICIMQGGEKEISGAAVNEKFDASQLYILSKGNVLMTETTTNDDVYQSILLFFSNDYLIDFLHRYSITPEKGSGNIPCLKIGKDDFLLNFEKSLEILKSEFKREIGLLQAKVDEILLYLLQADFLRTSALLLNILSKEKYTSLTPVVLANLDNNLTIRELAFLCNMSLSTFKRKFSEAFNTTPKQYFIEHRMRKAIALLKENRRPSDIYTELGYEGLPAFSTEFKKHFGVSPKAFIKSGHSQQHIGLLEKVQVGLFR